MIRVCILCYKLFWGNSTLCVSFVLFFIFVRVNAQFVKLNAQFARVNAQFVKENAQPDYPMNALLCICKTKRTLLPFKSLPVSVFLYNSPMKKNGGTQEIRIDFWSPDSIFISEIHYCQSSTGRST